MLGPPHAVSKVHRGGCSLRQSTFPAVDHVSHIRLAWVPSVPAAASVFQQRCVPVSRSHFLRIVRDYNLVTEYFM